MKKISKPLPEIKVSIAPSPGAVYPVEKAEDYNLRIVQQNNKDRRKK